MALSANFYTFTNHALSLPYSYRFGKNWKESTETKKRRRTVGGELAFCLAEDETVSATKRANQSHASYSQSENASQTISHTVAVGLPEVQDVLCYSFGFLSIKELGTVSMVCKKWKELAVDSRRVFVLSPWKSRESENIQYYNSKALEVMQGNPQEAITIYNRLLEFYPSSITIFLQRSKAFQIAKQYEESLKDLAKAIELDSNNFEAYQQRVTLNKEIFSSAVAETIVADLTKMIELNPNLVSNYADRGFAFLVLKKHEEAYKDVCMAIEKNPQVARPYVTRSIIIMLKDSNDYHGQLLALRDCSRAIELCPNSSFNYQHRAFILTKLHRLDEALSDYSKAIKLRPQNVYCYYKAASLLKKMNQYSEAIRHYKVILFDLLGKRFTEDRRNFEQTIQQRFHNDQDIASYLKVEVKHRIPKPSALSFPVK